MSLSFGLTLKLLHMEKSGTVSCARGHVGAVGPHPEGLMRTSRLA